MSSDVRREDRACAALAHILIFKSSFCCPLTNAHTCCCLMLALRAAALLYLSHAAAALAARGEWLPFPGGRTLHSSCVVTPDAAALSPLPPCPHLHPPTASYYGGWSVYAYLPAPTGTALAHMSATFTVRYASKPECGTVSHAQGPPKADESRTSRPVLALHVRAAALALARSRAHWHAASPGSRTATAPSSCSPCFR